MKLIGWFKTFFCLAFLGFCLYLYLEKQNEITELRMALPKLAKEIRSIQEENVQMHYAIEQFESPEHLMELAKSSEFSHLRHPFVKEVLTLKEGSALELFREEVFSATSFTAKIGIALGAKNLSQ